MGLRNTFSRGSADREEARRIPPVYALVAAWPSVLDLAAVNADHTDVGVVWVPLVVWVAIAAVLLGAGWAATRDVAKAALLTALLTFGLANFDAGDALLWVCLGAAVALTFVRRRVVFTLATIPATVFVVWMVVATGWALARAARAPEGPRPVAPVVDNLVAGERPDVFLLFLDGYGRHDRLLELHNFDDPVPAALRERGFRVLGGARSNYNQTVLSLASTLNLVYHQDLLTDMHPGAIQSHGLQATTRDNRMVRIARAAGYDTFFVPSDYALVQGMQVDRLLAPLLPIDDFHYILVNRSAIGDLMTLLGQPRQRVMHALHRRRVNDGLRRFGSVPQGDRPRFVVAHVIAPHPPFVFTADGAYRPTATPLFSDGKGWHADVRHRHDPYKETYSGGYVAKATYVGARIVETVDAILEQTDGQAIIALLGDHGSKRDNQRAETAAILAAVHFPDGDYADLRDDMTSVNVARALAQRMGAQVEPVEDRVYYSRYVSPYNFLDVTDYSR